MVPALVRSIATYSSEIWTFVRADETTLCLSERNILRSIFGAVQNKGQRRKLHNFELYKLCGEPDLVKYTKINRLKWAGKVVRMDNNWITKRMINTRPEGKRGTGRPKLRWWIMWTMISEFY
jgi:hypothetical protein